MLQTRVKKDRVVFTDMSRGQRVIIYQNKGNDWISLQLDIFDEMESEWIYQRSHTMKKDHVVPVLKILGETLDEFSELKPKS